MGLIKHKDENGFFFQWGQTGDKCYFNPKDGKSEDRAKNRALIHGYVKTKGTMEELQEIKPEKAQVLQMILKNSIQQEPEPEKFDALTLEDLKTQVGSMEFTEGMSDPTFIRMVNLFKRYFEAIEEKLNEQKTMIDDLAKKIPSSANRKLIIHRDESGFIKSVDVEAE